jgi:hypothetical protein
MPELSHADRVLIYCAGLLDDLAQRGLLEAGSLRITEQGRETYRRIQEGEWRPSTAEIQWGIAQIQAGCRAEAIKFRAERS